MPLRRVLTPREIQERKTKSQRSQRSLITQLHLPPHVTPAQVEEILSRVKIGERLRRGGGKR